MNLKILSDDQRIRIYRYTKFQTDRIILHEKIKNIYLNKGGLATQSLFLYLTNESQNLSKKSLISMKLFKVVEANPITLHEKPSHLNKGR